VKAVPVVPVPSIHTADTLAHELSAVIKFSRPVRKMRETRARATKLFVDLEMPSSKQIAFLAKYSRSFEDTELLDAAIGSWEHAAELVKLREYTMDRLRRVERGEWLEPFELFSPDQEASMKKQGAWVIRPSAVLFGSSLSSSASAPVKPIAGHTSVSAHAVSPSGKTNNGLDEQLMQGGGEDHSIMASKISEGGKVATDLEVFEAQMSKTSSTANGHLHGGGNDPVVGQVAHKHEPLDSELRDVKRAREIQRVSTVNWLRRVLSKITGKAMQQLADTESKFGDAVHFRGHDYAPKVAADVAKLHLTHQRDQRGC